MSEKQYLYTIENEIEQLNVDIDMKIVKGLPYKSEAARHVKLFKQLSKLQRKKAASFVFSFLL